MTNSNTHIVVGLSGGVDSSVTALLLKAQGFQVTAVFMQNWDAEADDPNCSATQDLADAKAISDKLDIPLYTVNFAKQYWNQVFEYFLDELAKGRTPNPDIFCNQEIKFKAFLEYAKGLKADFIATGHYAKLYQLDGVHQLQKALDSNKDQTYFLHRLNQYQLQHSIFPLGNYEKNQVRKIAKEHGLVNFNKKDSTGICFIGERKFKTFLSEYMLAQPGPIESDKGEVIGQHQGLMFYTLGQRQGLCIGGLQQYQEAPWYVVHKDIPRNVLVVGQQHDHPLLMGTILHCDQVNWIINIPKFPLNCSAKIRYRQMDQTCTVDQIEDFIYRVEFRTPQRAITPGQSVVFYQDDLCLGGGIIRSSDC